MLIGRIAFLKQTVVKCSKSFRLAVEVVFRGVNGPEFVHRDFWRTGAGGCPWSVARLMIERTDWQKKRLFQVGRGFLCWPFLLMLSLDEIFLGCDPTLFCWLLYL